MERNNRVCKYILDYSTGRNKTIINLSNKLSFSVSITVVAIVIQGLSAIISMLVICCTWFYYHNDVNILLSIINNL